jgi:hypothetical protein
MSTANVQLANMPIDADLACINNSATDIPAFTVVIVDATNTITNSITTLATQIGVSLPATGGNPSIGLGITQEIIKANAVSAGRVRVQGISQATGDGTCTAGQILDVSVTTAGRVKAHTAGKYSFCQALSTCADTEQLIVLLGFVAPNA